MNILRPLLDLLLALGLVAVLLGLFHRSVMQVVVESLDPLRSGVNSLASAIADARNRVSDAIATTLASLELGGENWKPSYLVGPFVITGFLAVFALCEYEMIVLTLAALGDWWRAPANMLDMTGLLAFSLIINAFFSLWMVGELRGRAFLVATHQLGTAERQLLTRLSAAAVVLSFLLILILAGFRADSMLADAAGAAAPMATAAVGPMSSLARDPLAVLDSAAGPAPAAVRPWEKGATWALMVGAPISLALSGAVAFDTGFLQVVKLSSLAVLALVRAALTLASVLVACLGGLLSFVYGTFIALLLFVQKVGITLARPVVSLVRLACDSARSQEGLNSPWIEALTSWAYDLEIPTEPVGSRHGIDGPEASEASASEASSLAPDPPGAEATETWPREQSVDDAGAPQEVLFKDTFTYSPDRNFNPFAFEGDTHTDEEDER